jgi:hypothetical protein
LSNNAKDGAAHAAMATSGDPAETILDADIFGNRNIVLIREAY